MKHNGLSGKQIVKKDSIITKEKNDDWSNVKKVLSILEHNNFPYFSKILAENETTYSYKFIEGQTLRNVVTMEIENILNIVDAIVMLQNIYKNENNQVIVHGDISPVNVVFDQNFKLNKIIDWDGCYFGSKYDDIGYICWLWVNFGDDKKQHSLYKNNIITIFKYLKYQISDVTAVKESILNRINKDSLNINQKKRENFLKEWYSYTKNWVIENWGEIENEFN